MCSKKYGLFFTGTFLTLPFFIKTNTMLLEKKITIIGAGGLGHPALYSLIHNLTNINQYIIEVIDFDFIETSNLNRQFFFTENDRGKNKAEVLVEKSKKLILAEKNIKLTAKNIALNKENIDQILYDSDLIIDATDNITIKFLINDYCVTIAKPFIYGGAIAETGQVLFYNPKDPNSFCLRCIFEDFTDDDFQNQTATCQQAGILGSVTGIIGSYQAKLCKDYFLDPTTRGTFIRFNQSEIKSIKHNRNKNCSIHGISQKKLDLLDKKCPETFLYTKLALETSNDNLLLTAYYSSKDSQENVAISCRVEGYNAWRIKTELNYYPLCILKCIQN